MVNQFSHDSLKPVKRYLFKSLTGKDSYFVMLPRRIPFWILPTSYLKTYLVVAGHAFNCLRTLEMKASSWIERLSRLTGLKRREVIKALEYWRSQKLISWDSTPDRLAFEIETEMPFIKMPNLANHLSKLRGTDLKLILAIQSLVNERTGWTCPVSKSRLANLAGIDRRRINGILKRLGIQYRPVERRRKADQKATVIGEKATITGPKSDNSPLLSRIKHSRIKHSRNISTDLAGQRPPYPLPEDVNQSILNGLSTEKFSTKGSQNFNVERSGGVSESEWQRQINMILKKLKIDDSEKTGLGN